MFSLSLCMRVDINCIFLRKHSSFDFTICFSLGFLFHIMLSARGKPVIKRLFILLMHAHNRIYECSWVYIQLFLPSLLPALQPVLFFSRNRLKRTQERTKVRTWHRKKGFQFPLRNYSLNLMFCFCYIFLFETLSSSMAGRKLKKIVASQSVKIGRIGLYNALLHVLGCPMWGKKKHVSQIYTTKYPLCWVDEIYCSIIHYMFKKNLLILAVRRTLSLVFTFFSKHSDSYICRYRGHISLWFKWWGQNTD